MRTFSLALLLCGCSNDPTVGHQERQADDEQPQPADDIPEADSAPEASAGQHQPLAHGVTPRWFAAATDDVDGDGYGVDEDCDDSDSAVSPGAAEDCASGADDDCDGAIDCEDADCATETSCVESCTDGLDNDADGYTDCADDECWGPCSITVHSTLHSGRADVFFDIFRSDTQMYVTAYSFSGSVSVVAASGTTNCQWWVPEAQVYYGLNYFTIVRSEFSTSVAWMFGWSVEDPTATFSEGCPLHPDQDVVPPKYKHFNHTDTDDWRVLDFGLTTTKGAWYHGAADIYSYRIASSLIYLEASVPELSPASASWKQ